MVLNDKQIEDVYQGLINYTNRRYPFVQDADKQDIIQDAMVKFVHAYRDRYIEQNVKPKNIAIRILDNLYIDRFCSRQTKNKHYKPTVSIDDANRREYMYAVEQGEFDKIGGEETIDDIMIDIRWGGVPISPFSPTAKVAFYGRGLLRCCDTRRYFSTRTNTIFEDIKAAKWKDWSLVFLALKNGNFDVSLHNSLSKQVSKKKLQAMIYRILLVCNNDLSNVTLWQFFEKAFDFDIKKNCEALNPSVLPALPYLTKTKKVAVKTEQKKIGSEIIDEKDRHQVEEIKDNIPMESNVKSIEEMIVLCINSHFPLPMEFVELYNAKIKGTSKS